jgi:hypothetical protein
MKASSFISCVMLWSGVLLQTRVSAQKKEINPVMQIEMDAARVYLDSVNSLPADQVKAYGGIDKFPGTVSAQTPRVKDFKILLNTDIPHWRSANADWVSTGLYAPAGEVITISLPKTALKMGLGIRIGCHTDNPSRSAKAFKRFPFGMSKTWEMSKAQTMVASAFGGTIYMLVPKSTPAEKIEVSVSGAVRAPFFVRGVTSEKDWKESIRNYDAPWAELCTQSISLSVPSSSIRNLDDPEALMTYWQKCMDIVQQLSGTASPQSQRIVYDVQISNGFMHSGYPVMAEGRLEVMTNLEKMQTGSSWGFFHEIGHNQQWGGWTPAGQVETTNNLFPLYVFDKVLGQKPALPKGWNTAGVTFDKTLELGAIGTNQNGRHGLSLTFWVQLINGLGWEPIEKTIASYHIAGRSVDSKDANEVWDNLLMRLSQFSGKDLTAYFASWGAENSESGIKKVKKLNLPLWKTTDMPGGGL